MRLLEIFWITHSCFKIKTSKGVVIYTDPYGIPIDEEKADIILASHDHHDHFDNGSIQNIWKNSTVLIGPSSISKKLKKFNGKGLKIGETYIKDDIKVILVPAYNITKMFHPKTSEFAGFIIEMEGKKIYHAGDTDRIPEMKNLKKENMTVALLPVGGTYTMDFTEAVEAAADIKPTIVVPMHDWEKDLNVFKSMVGKKDNTIKVEILRDKTLKV